MYLCMGVSYAVKSPDENVYDFVVVYSKKYKLDHNFIRRDRSRSLGNEIFSFPYSNLYNL